MKLRNKYYYSILAIYTICTVFLAGSSCFGSSEISSTTGVLIEGDYLRTEPSEKPNTKSHWCVKGDEFNIIEESDEWFHVYLPSIDVVGYIKIASTDKYKEELKSTDVIMEVQQLLNEKGYDCGSPDGIIGARTKSAVLEYKKENKLGEDSIVNRELLETLKKDMQKEDSSDDEGSITQEDKNTFVILSEEEKDSIIQEFNGLYKEPHLKAYAADFSSLNNGVFTEYKFDNEDVGEATMYIDTPVFYHYNGKICFVNSIYSGNPEEASCIYYLQYDENGQKCILYHYNFLGQFETAFVLSEAYTEEQLIERVMKSQAMIPPAIGMTAEEVLASTWGKPQKINKTTTQWSVSEQWVYDLDRYVYLEDDVVVAIQE